MKYNIESKLLIKYIPSKYICKLNAVQQKNVAAISINANVINS